MTWEWPDWTCR